MYIYYFYYHPTLSLFCCHNNCVYRTLLLCNVMSLQYTSNLDSYIYFFYLLFININLVIPLLVTLLINRMIFGLTEVYHQVYETISTLLFLTLE